MISVRFKPILTAMLLVGVSLPVGSVYYSWAQNRPPLNAPPKPAVKASIKPSVKTPIKPLVTPKQTPTPKKKPDERVLIYADKAIYKKADKQAQAIGHVKVIQDNTTIYADEVMYHEDTKQSFIEDGVKIVQINKKEKNRVTVITGDKMTAWHEEKRIFLEKDVRLDRQEDRHAPPPPQTEPKNKTEKRKRIEGAIKRSRTVITSNQMEYFTKSENANLDGNVVVLQKEKKITGEKAAIKGEEDGDTITIENNAKVVQINGYWLAREKVVQDDPNDEEKQRLLRELLTIEADKIVLYRATDDLEATGKVKVVQKAGTKERVATGDQVLYKDKEQTATLIGNVRIQKENGDWLTADKAIFYTESENFEAIGSGTEQVLSEFTLDDENNPKPKDPINSPSPDFNLDDHQPGQRLPAWLRPGQPTPKPSPTPSPSPTRVMPTPKPSGSPTPKPRATPTPKPSVSPTPTPKPTASTSSKPNAPPVSPKPTPTPVESTLVIN